MASDTKKPAKNQTGSDEDIKKITDELSAQLNASTARVHRAERRAVLSSSLSVLSFLIIIGGIGYLFLGPRFFDDVRAQKDEQVARLHENIEAVQAKQEELAAKQQAIQARVQEFLAADLFTQISQIQNLSAEMRTMNERIQLLQSSQGGQVLLDESMTDLQGTLAGMNGRVETLEQELEKAKQGNNALASMLEGITGNELKAAAMLMAVSQLRSSLMQEASYQHDLETVRMLAGDDAELLAAIDRMAPYAESGILNRDSLNTEFKGLAGDIVMARLRGEDVSFQDRLQDRLGNLVSVRKTGMVEGQDTEAVVARAEALLERGDVQGALAELKTLEGEPRETAQPFIEQAEARVLADQFAAQMTQSLMGRLSGVNGQAGIPSGAFNGLIQTLDNAAGALPTAAPSIQPINPFSAPADAAPE